MSATNIQDLSGVAATMLITLYFRALETSRPDALLKDEQAAALVEGHRRDFERVSRMPMSEVDKTSIILRNREFDRRAHDFLARHGQAVVVHLGCGLDARFERVDDGRVVWYDLDFPDVIALRRKLLGGEGKRRHFLAGSVFDEGWLESVGVHRGASVLFLAEGVSMYCTEAQWKRLVLTLRERFPGSEFVFDAFSPFHVWMSNLQRHALKLSVHFYFGIWTGRKVERWGEGLRLIGDWGFFDEPEPRMSGVRWMRHIGPLNRVMRVYHFRLGKMPEWGGR